VTELFVFVLAVVAIVIVGLIVGIILSRPLDRWAAGSPPDAPSEGAPGDSDDALATGAGRAADGSAQQHEELQ
jgi:hypothetical protein